MPCWSVESMRPLRDQRPKPLPPGRRPSDAVRQLANVRELMPCSMSMAGCPWPLAWR